MCVSRIVIIFVKYDKIIVEQRLWNIIRFFRMIPRRSTAGRKVFVLFIFLAHMYSLHTPLRPIKTFNAIRYTYDVMTREV